jgi:CRISPR-associated protein Cas4
VIRAVGHTRHVGLPRPFREPSAPGCALEALVVTKSPSIPAKIAEEEPTARAKPLPLGLRGPPPSPPTHVPARMVNEVLYCERLMHIEWVQGDFADNAFTVEGRLVHRRADRPGGAMPPLASTAVGGPGEKAEAPDAEDLQTDPGPPPYTARSVWLTSDALGLTAKIDVVESETDGTVVPIEYKRGRAPDVAEGAYLPERAQLCAHVLLLREHGYRCEHGALYFAGSRRRVAVTIDEDLVRRTLLAVTRAKELASVGDAPAPLTDDPRCNGCSLVGVCLPDETNLLRRLEGLAPDEALPPPEPERADPLDLSEGDPWGSCATTSSSRSGPRGCAGCTRHGTRSFRCTYRRRGHTSGSTPRSSSSARRPAPRPPGWRTPHRCASRQRPDQHAGHPGPPRARHAAMLFQLRRLVPRPRDRPRSEERRSADGAAPRRRRSHHLPGHGAGIRGVQDQELPHHAATQPRVTARGVARRARSAGPEGGASGRPRLAARARRHRGARILRAVHGDAEGRARSARCVRSRGTQPPSAPRSHQCPAVLRLCAAHERLRRHARLGRAGSDARLLPPAALRPTGVGARSDGGVQAPAGGLGRHRRDQQRRRRRGRLRDQRRAGACCSLTSAAWTSSSLTRSSATASPTAACSRFRPGFSAAC